MPRIDISFMPNMQEGGNVILKKAKHIVVRLDRSYVQLLVDGILVRQWRDNSSQKIIPFDSRS